MSLKIINMGDNMSGVCSNTYINEGSVVYRVENYGKSYIQKKYF